MELRYAKRKNKKKNKIQKFPSTKKEKKRKKIHVRLVLPTKVTNYSNIDSPIVF